MLNLGLTNLICSSTNKLLSFSSHDHKITSNAEIIGGKTNGKNL